MSVHLPDGFFSYLLLTHTSWERRKFYFLLPHIFAPIEGKGKGSPLFEPKFHILLPHIFAPIEAIVGGRKGREGKGGEGKGREGKGIPPPPFTAHG